MPAISVISPVYGVEKYIRNFITSLKNQTFKDFELILINDGTKDNSIKIAEIELKRAKLNYRIINKKNGGQSSARNIGIMESTGDYIVLVDSDDTLQSMYLENFYKVAKKSKCDVVICDINRVTDNNIFEETQEEFIFTTKSGREFYKDFFMHNIEIGPVSLFIKNKFLKKINLKFNENSRYSEEFSFITLLLHEAKIVSHLEQKNYNYCLRNGSVSTASDIEKVVNGFEEIKKQDKLLKNCNCKYCKKYKEFAYSRWIIATSRFCSKHYKYKDYKRLMNKLNYKIYMKKLYNYPSRKIRIVAHFIMFSLFLSYNLFRVWRNY